MGLEAAMIAELDTIPQISGKVFPLVAPRTDINNNPVTAPYVTYEVPYGLQVNSLEGYLSNESIEVELNLIAPTYSAMKSITKLVVEKIISFQARVIADGGPFIQDVTYEEPIGLFEAQPGLYRCEMRFTLYI